MRIGLLGAGAMGSLHAAAYAAMDDVEIAGVVGRREGRVKLLADRLGVPAHTDPRALLDDESIDALDITLPTRLHREYAIAALERGKHVFCETPLAACVEDVDAMIEVARASGRLLQVALLMRVAEPGVHIREQVSSGALGRPLVVSTERLWPGLASLDADDHHGDALEELLLFDFDFLNWCFGLPKSVSASGIVRPDGFVLHAFATLDFGELRVAAEGSRIMPPSFTFRISARVICERGTIETTLDLPPDRPPRVSLTHYGMEGEPETREVRQGNPFEIECRRFVQCVRGEADPELLGAGAARDALRIAAAARESIARGVAVAP